MYKILCSNQQLTIMVTVQNVEVISNKFNVEWFSTEIISSSQIYDEVTMRAVINL
jgi:hypothetical protein